MWNKSEYDRKYYNLYMSESDRKNYKIQKELEKAIYRAKVVNEYLKEKGLSIDEMEQSSLNALVKKADKDFDCL